MLLRQHQRLMRSLRMDKVVIATSTSKEDGAIAELCKRHDIDCVRGSLSNVLDRFYVAAKAFSPDIVIRLTGDCPLCDPDLIDMLIDHFEDGGYDYVSNTLKSSWPDGLDAEVMTMAALTKAHENASEDFELEHVTPYLYRHPEVFKLGSLINENDLSHLRWTVDIPEDLELVRRIYDALYPDDPWFNTKAILQFLSQNPELQDLNKHGQRSSPESVLNAFDQTTK